jgi:hypothetical protein
MAAISAAACMGMLTAGELEYMEDAATAPNRATALA